MAYLPETQPRYSQQDWYKIPDNYREDFWNTAISNPKASGEIYGGKFVDYSQVRGWGKNPTAPSSPTPTPTPADPYKTSTPATTPTWGTGQPNYPTSQGPSGYQWPAYPTMDIPLNWRNNVAPDDLEQLMRDYQAQQAQWWQKQAEQQARQWEWQNKLDPEQAWGRWNMEQEANRRANTEEDRQLQMQLSTGYNPYARHGYTNNTGYQRPVRIAGR